MALTRRFAEIDFTNTHVKVIKLFELLRYFPYAVRIAWKQAELNEIIGGIVSVYSP